MNIFQILLTIIKDLTHGTASINNKQTLFHRTFLHMNDHGRHIKIKTYGAQSSEDLEATKKEMAFNLFFFLIKDVKAFD